MSIGVTELILILVVVLLIFGSKGIPELARALGRASYEYKKAKNIIQQEAEGIKDSLSDKDEKSKEYQINDNAQNPEI